MRSTSLAPAGFLTSRIRISRPPTCTVSARPNAAFVACSPGNDLGQANIQRGGERGGGERVVDVVEAGQREGDLGDACRSLKREAGRAVRPAG